jgi:hypothetical protein
MLSGGIQIGAPPPAGLFNGGGGPLASSINPSI